MDPATTDEDAPLWHRLARPLAATFVGLESHQVVTRAMRVSGLADFGPMDFAEPLEILCRSLERDAHVHPVGRVRARRRLVDALVARARQEQLLEERSAIVDAPVATPIVIIGLPHAGGSLLRDRLADEPGSRAPPTDHDLLAPSLASMEFEVDWHVPAFAEWYDSADLTHAYQRLRTTLQVLDGEGPSDPSDRWVIEGWQHVEQLGAIANAFPDAVIVQVHRDPDAVLAEWVDTVARRRRESSDRVAPEQLAKYWEWRLDVMLARATHYRAEHPELDVYDVAWDELRDDAAGVVERISRDSPPRNPS